MNVLKAAWIILLLVGISLSGYGYHLYSKQSEELAQYAQNTKLVESYQEHGALSLERELEEKEDIKTLKKLAQEREKWWFLQDIEENLGDKLRPMFKNIGPVTVVDHEDYLEMSRELEVSASYQELIQLFEELEKERGFTIGRLRINRDTQDIERQVAQFVLTTIEVKRSFFDQLRNMGADIEGTSQMALVSESLIIDPTWQEREKLRLKEEAVDPFISYEDRQILLARQPVVAEEKVMVPINLSSQYRLQGIVQFSKYLVAIISPDHILREGDKLDKKQVVSITRQKVTLIEGPQEYYIDLPEDSGINNTATETPADSEDSKTGENKAVDENEAGSPGKDQIKQSLKEVLEEFLKGAAKSAETEQAKPGDTETFINRTTTLSPQ